MTLLQNGILQGELKQSRLVVIAACMFLGAACPKVADALPPALHITAGVISGIGAGALAVGTLLIDTRRKEDNNAPQP